MSIFGTRSWDSQSRDEPGDASGTRPGDAAPLSRMDPLDEPDPAWASGAPAHAHAAKKPRADDEWPEFAAAPGKGPGGKPKGAEASAITAGEVVRYIIIGLGLSAGVLIGAFAVSTDREVEAWELKAGHAPTRQFVLDLHRMGGRAMVYRVLVSAAGFGFGVAAIGVYSLLTGGARARAEAARRNPPVARGWSDVADPGFVFAPEPGNGPGGGRAEDAGPIVGPDGPIGGRAAPTPSAWPAPRSRFDAPYAGPAYSTVTGPFPDAALPGLVPPRKPSDLGQRQAPIELIGGAVGLLLLGLFTFVQLSWLEFWGGETKVWWGIALAYNTLGKEAAVAVCAVPGVLLLIRAIHRIATD